MIYSCNKRLFAFNSRAWLVLGAAIIICLFTGTKASLAAEESSGQPRLEVQNLIVTPRTLMSGDSVEVEATVANSGDAPAANLRIALAVVDTDSSRTAKPEGDYLPEVLESLGPGESVTFRRSVKLEGDGWLRVGIMASSDNARLVPEGKRVHVIVAKTSIFKLFTMFISFLVLIALGTTLYRTILHGKRDDDLPLPSLKKPVLGIGVFIVILDLFLPTIIINNWQSAWSIKWLPILMTVLFAVGWVTIGTSLRPGHSYLRGALLATVSYVLIGLGWLIIFNSVFDGISIIEALIQHPLDSLQIVTTWPFQLTQLSGIFDVRLI